MTADEIQPGKRELLSEWLQRNLSEKRPQEIARYLRKNRDRFFSSLVVAMYGGRPEWHSFTDLRVARQSAGVPRARKGLEECMGFLSIDDDSEMLALDGQHRLAGIRLAVETDPALLSEQASVLFVGHGRTREARKRTRHLFISLNKHAVSVPKAELIALDEDDAMARVTRWLVDEDPDFSNGQILFSRTDALPHGNKTHLMSIGMLYDIIRLILPLTEGAPSVKDMELIRADSGTMDRYKSVSTHFLRELIALSEPLSSCLGAGSMSARVATIGHHRHSDGGHVLFWPIGLKVFAEVYATLRGAGFEHGEAMGGLKELPTDLGGVPYSGTLWNGDRGRIEVGAGALVRGLLVSMLLSMTAKAEASLARRYAKRLGREVQDVQLPQPVAW